MGAVRFRPDFCNTVGTTEERVAALLGRLVGNFFRIYNTETD